MIVKWVFFIFSSPRASEDCFCTIFFHILPASSVCCQPVSLLAFGKDHRRKPCLGAGDAHYRCMSCAAASESLSAKGPQIKAGSIPVCDSVRNQEPARGQLIPGEQQGQASLLSFVLKKELSVA